MQKHVYFDHRKTLYCGFAYDNNKNVQLSDAFFSEKYKKRQKKIEWEHVVPAENFGRNFIEWREGHQSCISRKGKAYKGRRCAQKSIDEYRIMQSDMNNLFPALGAINALRRNYNFGVLRHIHPSPQLCSMKFTKNRVEPSDISKGRIARTYKYMSLTYSKYKMSRQQKQLMDAWDKMFPVNEWECKRSKRIAAIQTKVNAIVKSACSKINLW